MTELLTHVEFRSDRFPAQQDEEHLVNPNIHGRALAEFLCSNLPVEGFQPTIPCAEDWGWRIDVPNKDFQLWIGCGNYAEYPDGYLCFIEPHKRQIRRLFRKIETTDHVAALQRALDRILTEENGIHAKRWWTYQEFNYPR